MSKAGFALYKASAKDRIKSDLKDQMVYGGRVTAAAILAELTRRWEQLPADSRENWNKQTGRKR